VQRTQSSFILRVDLCSVLQQVFCHLQVIVARCDTHTGKMMMLSVQSVGWKKRLIFKAHSQLFSGLWRCHPRHRKWS